MLNEPADNERVLVVKPSSLGDVVHTLPAVSALKRTYPNWDIQWLVNDEWAPLLDGNPELEDVIHFPRHSFQGIGGLMKARSWAKQNLALRHFDRVLDFQGLLRSALLAKASGAESVIGFSRAREMAPFWYTEKIDLPDWDSQHAVTRYLALSQAVGADISEANDIGFLLPDGEPVDGFPADLPVLALHPFSRGTGKSLTEQEVLEFCVAANDAGDVKRVVLLGSEPWAGQPLPTNVLDQMGKTSLAQLIWILRQADAVVSVDSGPMHLAAAITDRLISIHTWTDPAKVGPWRKEAWFWRDGQLLKVGDTEPGQFPEQRKRKQLYEHLRQRTKRLLPEGTMASIAAALVAGKLFDG